ncbi:1,2-phenylacetyl-CoA epoxidase subunit PaaD [Oxalobacteraceae bacterium A2-2]
MPTTTAVAPERPTAAHGEAHAEPHAAGDPRAAMVWNWLAAIPDPEIPVISIVDLGIVRDVALDGASCTVTITPTYSGCPATQVIADAISAALRQHGVEARLQIQLAPAWTSDWLGPEAKARLQAYGIAPPAEHVIALSALRDARRAISRRAAPRVAVACPHCGSAHTELTSQFGSTPCKALYKCLDCREPFDYFKCH